MQIAVENFRSFDSTDFLATSDLNIFIGKNSSGKSSLLRLYPLMKQTLMNKTSEPFLWYSPDYVDFGEYDDVLGFNMNKPIVFSYKFKLSAMNFYNPNNVIGNIEEFTRNVDYGLEDFFSQVVDIENIDVEVKISTVKDFLSQIIFIVAGVTVELNFNKYKLLSFIVDSSPIYIHNLSDIPGVRVVSRKRNLMNTVNVTYNENNSDKNIDLRKIMNSSKQKSFNNNYSFRDNFIMPEILKLMSSLLDDLKLEVIVEESDLELLVKNIFIGDFLLLEKNHLVNKFNNFFKVDLSDYPQLTQITSLFIAGYVNDFLGAIDDQMTEYFSKVKYIAPLRASVQRYYRMQGIAVSEMDATGANIPMILANMSDSEFSSLQEWTRENFRFVIERTPTPGHVSLSIGFENEKTRNIIDLGFGYSQLLPIIVEIWNVSNRGRSRGRRSKNIPYTIVIEQPELHLHPAMQAEFIDVCLKIIKNSKNVGSNEIKFVIETHSQTIINRISESIRKEKINKSSVTINIVNINNEKNSTVKSIEFDEKGQLMEWPIGFFSPESIKYDYKF